MIINKDPTPVLEKIYLNPSWCWLSGDEKETLQKIDSVDVLNNFICSHAQDGWKGDPVAFANRISPLLPEKIFEISINDFQNKFDANIGTAEYYLQTCTAPSQTLQALFHSKMDTLLLVLDHIITTFGVGDFLKPAQSAMESQSKIFKLFILLSLASALASLVSPIGAAIFLGSIVLISLVWASIKPTPSELPNATNWTKELRSGSYATQGRKVELNQLAAGLERGRHMMILGPSRSGKSLLAKDLAKRVLDGEFPKLAGKTFFHINMATLTSATNALTSKSAVDEIVSTMGENYDNCILVLDEIHNICKPGCPVADTLKTLLDVGGRFAHVIAITTEEEYNDYVVTNGAFTNRFDNLIIENTDEQETLRIMSDQVLRGGLESFYSENDLKKIYEDSNIPENDKSAPQPYTALQALNKAMQETGAAHISKIEAKIAKKSNQIDFIYSNALIRKDDQTELENFKGKPDVKTLIKRREKLKEKLQKETKEFSVAIQQKRKLGPLTKSIYLDTLKIKNTAEHKTDIIRIIMLDKYIKPSLSDYVLKKLNPNSIDDEDSDTEG
jgi:ATP-dependent Clp protease ATP-binding subunit ClpA